MEEIIVDEEGYQQFLAELERLKEQSLSISSFGTSAYQDAVGDGWHDNFAFEETVRQSMDVAKIIENMSKQKKHIKVIKPKVLNDSIINIGDSLRIKIFYSDDEVEETCIKLTGNYIPQITSNKEIQEITLNSPLGKALYLKSVDAKDIEYFVNNKKIQIKIVEKIIS